MGPKELVNSKLWWQGPEWLLQGPENWPSRTDWRRKSKDLPELKKVVMTVELPDNALLSRFSSYTRLLRVMTWCVRFLFNLRHSIEERRLSHLLTLQEKKGGRAHLPQTESGMILLGGGQLPEQ